MEPYIGGQAIMEGVMMRNGTRVAMAVRQPDDQIHVETEERSPWSKKYPILGLPLIRGFVMLLESTILGMQVLTKSTNISTGEEEEELTPWEITLTLTAAVGFAALLFIFVPVYAAKWLTKGSVPFAIMEGTFRLAIFIAYIWLIGKTKDIQRVFQYHGAEHKTINCYEAGDPLTVENVRRHRLLHKRCGTSFLLFVMLLSVVVFAFFSGQQMSLLTKMVSRVALVPVIAGVAYELIRWSAGQTGPFAAGLVLPGLLMQKMTTREPDNAQIEVAIASVLAVVEDCSLSQIASAEAVDSKTVFPEP